MATKKYKTLVAHIRGSTVFLMDSTDLGHSFSAMLSGTLLISLNLTQPPIILETIDLTGSSTDSGTFFRLECSRNSVNKDPGFGKSEFVYTAYLKGESS